MCKAKIASKRNEKQNKIVYVLMLSTRFSVERVNPISSFSFFSLVFKLKLIACCVWHTHVVGMIRLSHRMVVRGGGDGGRVWYTQYKQQQQQQRQQHHTPVYYTKNREHWGNTLCYMMHMCQVFGAWFVVYSVFSSTLLLILSPFSFIRVKCFFSRHYIPEAHAHSIAKRENQTFMQLVDSKPWLFKRWFYKCKMKKKTSFDHLVHCVTCLPIILFWMKF